jgi:hypothetical protein
MGGRHPEKTVLLALTVILASCTSTDPTQPAADGIAAAFGKRDCGSDSSHPSCKPDDADDSSGGEFVPADFPAALLGGGANAMVSNPHDQTVKHGNSKKQLGGFNPEYQVALDFAGTLTAGWERCVADSRGQSPGWEASLFANLKEETRARYTIVRISTSGVGASHADHEIQVHDGEGGVTVNLRGAPTVLFAQPVPELGQDSGTYRFEGGTLEIRLFLGNGKFQSLDCPNEDVVEVFFDF